MNGSLFVLQEHAYLLWKDIQNKSIQTVQTSTKVRNNR